MTQCESTRSCISCTLVGLQAFASVKTPKIFLRHNALYLVVAMLCIAGKVVPYSDGQEQIALILHISEKTRSICFWFSLISPVNSNPMPRWENLGKKGGGGGMSRNSGRGKGGEKGAYLVMLCVGWVPAHKPLNNLLQDSFKMAPIFFFSVLHSQPLPDITWFGYSTRQWVEGFLLQFSM